MGNQALLQEWFDSVWNRHDVEAVSRLLAPQGRLHDTAVPGGRPLGVDDFKTLARALQEAVPDIRFEVVHAFESADHVAGHVVVTGTHSGRGLGAPPTGKKFRISGVSMAKVADGRIVEGWSTFDLLSLFDQLGIVKRPALGDPSA